MSSDPALWLPSQPDDPVVWRPAAEACGAGSGVGAPPFEVFVGCADSLDDRRLPIAGRYERDTTCVRFWPSFGFVADQDYVVRFRWSRGSERLSEFRIAARAPMPAAQVTAIYPSGEVLPENVLRFYVHFSVPMAPRVAHDAIRLRSESGEIDSAAFMRFTQELWSSDRTRLTVLIDPARIKRNLTTAHGPRPALVDGGRYTLTLAKGWTSADGSSTLPQFEKTFDVAAALRTQPEVARWTWNSPRAGTGEPFVVRFDRPFDRQLLTRALRIASEDGRPIEGTPQVGPGETSWSFMPSGRWPGGGLRVVAADRLEDIAGNNLRGPLERALVAGT